MIPSVEKKIAELEMGLLHLQQNIDIPEISLTFHPFVIALVKKCGGDGKKPSPEEYADKVDDSTFLNALQHGVNRWIREIQKVCLQQCCLCVFVESKNIDKFWYLHTASLLQGNGCVGLNRHFFCCRLQS